MHGPHASISRSMKKQLLKRFWQKPGGGIRPSRGSRREKFADDRAACGKNTYLSAEDSLKTKKGPNANLFARKPVKRHHDGAISEGRYSHAGKPTEARKKKTARRKINFLEREAHTREGMEGGEFPQRRKGNIGNSKNGHPRKAGEARTQRQSQGGGPRERN